MGQWMSRCGDSGPPGQWTSRVCGAVVVHVWGQWTSSVCGAVDIQIQVYKCTCALDCEHPGVCGGKWTSKCLHKFADDPTSKVYPTQPGSE